MAGGFSHDLHHIKPNHRGVAQPLCCTWSSGRGCVGQWTPVRLRVQAVSSQKWNKTNAGPTVSSSLERSCRDVCPNTEACSGEAGPRSKWTAQHHTATQAVKLSAHV